MNMRSQWQSCGHKKLNKPSMKVASQNSQLASQARICITKIFVDFYFKKFDLK